MNREDIERFFKTLFLGDFVEGNEQSSAAVLVSGLLGLVPILDQVLDVRDIAGSLFRIQRSGGFKNASSDQLVDLGFAAFGVIPEVGSAFKGVFKPLWKERRQVKGFVNGGLEAVERMLDMRKGGALKWINTEVIGKWTSLTVLAIQAVDTALASMVEMLEFIANAKGWKDWLFPDSIQVMAGAKLPALREMQGKIREPIQRASDEILAFLQDLVGEQAAAVLMGVGQRVVVSSGHPGTRTQSGHNKADITPKGVEGPRQPQGKTGGSPTTEAQKGAGGVNTAIARTRDAFKKLANAQKGLIGEHMVDYYELKRLKGSWPHDSSRGDFSPKKIAKINSPKRPINLVQADLPYILSTGIDAVWKHDGFIDTKSYYTVTEAKARESKHILLNFGKKRAEAKHLNGNDRLIILNELLGRPNGGAKMTQMSEDWVESRALGEHLDNTATRELQNNNATRRVVLVTAGESQGVGGHISALMKIILAKTPPEAVYSEHEEHGITMTWDAKDIDAVVKARSEAAKQAKPGNKPSNKPQKPK
jgi:hypothetical protein